MKTAYTYTNLNFTLENITVSVLNILFERFTRTIPTHSHGNGCYEVHYIPYGCGTVKVNDTYHEITPNTLYITGPHVEHAQTPNQSDPMQEYCIYFKLRRLARSQKASPVMDAFMSMPFWIGKDSQGIHDLMKQLFQELEQQRTGYRTQVELLLTAVIIALVRNYEQPRHFCPPVFQNELSDHKSRIIEEYFLYEYQSLSLSDLANRLNLSPRQTQRLLTEYYNKSFQEKKAEARMSVAAILLGDKSRSISSIADALNYSSPEHFSNAFRKYYHVSPRTFRKGLSSFSLPG